MGDSFFVLMGAPRIRDDNAFFGYIWAIAANTYKKYLYKKGRIRCEELDEGAPGYGIIAIPDGCADMLFQIIRPLMAGIIRILLAVTLKMLITLDILKVVPVIVVYGVMVVHGFGIRCQEIQYIVVIKAFHVFVCMRCIAGNGLVSIKSETCSLRRNKDDRVVPVNDLSWNAFLPCDQDKLQILAKLAEPICGTGLEFRNVSLTGH